MTDVKRCTAAARFMADWKGRSDEKQETQALGSALLQKVYGMDELENILPLSCP